MNELVSIMQSEFNAGRVTVAELASWAGCSRQFVYNVIQGDQMPGVETASAFASALGYQLKIVLEKNPTIGVDSDAGAA